MYWTFELISHLYEAPFPANKHELIDYAKRTGAPQEVIMNLEMIEDEEELYNSIEDLCPDYLGYGEFYADADEDEY
jgi:hypothetical protein